MPSLENKKICIVGGGIIGAAVAHEIMLRYMSAHVTLFEKEAALAAHQTGHNSGVVHAGLYYQPGSLKAKLARSGAELLKDFALRHGLPYEECGKILLAKTPEEAERLQNIYQIAKANAVPGVQYVDDKDRMRKEAPDLKAHAMLLSPVTAITDYVAVTNKLAEELTRMGGSLQLGTRVLEITPKENGSVRVLTKNEELGEETRDFDYVVTCAGLQSDRLARQSNRRQKYPMIIPFSGSYQTFNDAARQLAGKYQGAPLIYPTPDPRYPFLGVHFTRRVSGAIIFGPTASISLKREGYKRCAFSLRDTLSLILSSGFWLFLVKNFRAAILQLRQGTKSNVARQIAQLLGRDVKKSDLKFFTEKGIRAQAVTRTGELEDDFVIVKDRFVTHVSNAPSPGATSSLAIAKYIVDEIAEGK